MSASDPKPLVLASASPRRRALLTAVGFDVSIRPAHGEELWPGGDAGAAAIAVARQKLKAAWQRLAADDPAAEHPWIAADTVVICEGDVLGKPRDHAHAHAMLTQLSGTTLEVVTGVVIRFWGLEQARAVTTRVSMRHLDAGDIARYLAQQESWDKAGAYAIQGQGESLVDRIEGSYTNVVGLPVAECLESLQALSQALTQKADRASAGPLHPQR